MVYAKQAGLANPKCQLYMLFYYIGPALVALQMKCSCVSSGVRSRDEQIKKLSTRCDQNTNGNNLNYGSVSPSNSHQTSSQIDSSNYSNQAIEDSDRSWPTKPLFVKATLIALFDIFAQSMVYTGNNLAGPTIFAIIYSSVTIWTALYSKVLLNRILNKLQWMGVILVVIGLSLTASDTKKVGERVFSGAMLILVGSSFHGLTYVLSERIMTAAHERISIRANCAVQGMVATIVLLIWQIIYTWPNRHELILEPMNEAGTSYIQAIVILTMIALANTLHSVTFYTTLKHCPGGSTSAGVLKGLQAVLVFLASSIILCGRMGGIEMCWNLEKFISLVVVVGGILVYGTFTETKKISGDISSNVVMRGLSMPETTANGGYNRVESVDKEEVADNKKVMCV